MIKTNLPVLILKDLALFPNTEIRLEFDTLEVKKLLTVAESFYENNIFIVISDIAISDIDIVDLSKLGVIGHIKMRMDMPNGRTRIIINGVNRGRSYAYSKDDDIFEGMIGNLFSDPIDSSMELAYIRVIQKHLTNYINNIPSISNAPLNEISTITNLSKMTDMVVNFMPLMIERKVKYIGELNPCKRAEMLIRDINDDLKIVDIEKGIDLKLSKSLEKDQHDYLLREKIKLIKEELGDIKNKDDDVDNFKAKALELNLPINILKRLEDEIARYETCNINSPEIGIIRSYIEWLLKIPWIKETVDISDLSRIKKSLDKTHYGLDEIKERIIEYLAVKQNTNNIKSPIICLVGPPGVGKTTLAKSIAISLNRRYTKISVGGINDEAEIIGHRRTYLGAYPGKIIYGLSKAGTINPVFIIDEIDKMTKDIKGDPASALLEVLDPEQNRSFIDNYIEEEYDLSKVMFIATANYLDKIPLELKDRLEIIEMSSYTELEKLDIAKSYILPRIITSYGLKKNQVKFSDKAFLSIIRNYTKEAGVRELERMISQILRKIVLERLTNNPATNYEVTELNLEKYLGLMKYLITNNTINTRGVVNGMAYLAYGGDILRIEAICYEGNGNITLTGNLGDVLKESATIAFSYLKAHAADYEIEYSRIVNSDIHIHIPEGAIPKDGPSAGVAITTALISLFTNRKVDSLLAMTGEITLTGEVLPVGGIKEKVIGAFTAGIKEIFLPIENKRDLIKVPIDIQKNLDFHFVTNYKEIYNTLFSNKHKIVL